ncbi:rhythmically expressed gene 2 protein-like, partial [Teleopsis dalmanni]|uniref:rhythmically expressed gene 2 protein-like n=1 Tax=Teleopsis dalmanni TaxID=139649 RepID=UPI0018CF4C50
PEQLDMLAETLLREYRTKEYWSYMEGSVELVQKIRDADKFVGIISNFDPSLSTVLREMEIEHLFDFILTSYEAGAQKPDAKIFSIPLERCNIKPNEALHIGNMYEIDYVGAKNSGWSSLLISQDSNKYENVEVMHVYASIKDVINALENKDIKW